MSSREPQSNVESLVKIFQCFICMGNVRDARLCPHCSKLCCYRCIRRWLTETRAQCPHCRSSLRVEELIVCRWAEEVHHQLDSLQQGGIPTLTHSHASQASSSSTSSEVEKEIKCSTHPKEELSVYCDTCKSCICPQCALWDLKHAGHVLKQVEEIFDDYDERIREQLALLRGRFVDVISSRLAVDKNIEAVKTVKDKCDREIRNAVELMMSRVDTQLEAKLNMLMNQKAHLNRKSEDVECLLQEIEHFLNSECKSKIIGHNAGILKVIEDSVSQSAFVVTPVLPEFESPLVPSYESKTFLVTDFSSRRAKADSFYSPTLSVNGMDWRLKFYPDGNGVVRGSHLSLFLELSSGSPEPAKYEYRIEMIYQLSNDPSKNMMREFASDFEVGECWGYNRFFRLDLLETEGYLDGAMDSIKLKFDVRPPTYYQKCKDQTWHIAKLEAMKPCEGRDEDNSCQSRHNQHGFPKGSSRDVVASSSGRSQDNARPEHESRTEKYSESVNPEESELDLEGFTDLALNPSSIVPASTSNGVEESEIGVSENGAVDSLEVVSAASTLREQEQLDEVDEDHAPVIDLGGLELDSSAAAACESEAAEGDFNHNPSSGRSDNDSGGDSHDVEMGDWNLFNE